MSTRQVKLITTETAGSKITSTTTINNINPTANGATMKEFAQKLNAFTNNIYTKSNLVETYNLDTEVVPTPSTPKTQASITLDKYTFTKSQTSTGNAEANITVTSDYAGVPFTSPSTNDLTPVYFTEPNRFQITGNATGTVEILIPETSTYTSATATITITE